MHARTLRYYANVSRQFHDSSRRFGESIRIPIANSSHPSEIGTIHKSVNNSIFKRPTFIIVPLKRQDFITVNFHIKRTDYYGTLSNSLIRL